MGSFDPAGGQYARAPIAKVGQTPPPERPLAPSPLFRRSGNANADHRRLSRRTDLRFWGCPKQCNLGQPAKCRHPLGHASNGQTRFSHARAIRPGVVSPPQQCSLRDQTPAVATDIRRLLTASVLSAPQGCLHARPDQSHHRRVAAIDRGWAVHRAFQHLPGWLDHVRYHHQAGPLRNKTTPSKERHHFQHGRPRASQQRDPRLATEQDEKLSAPPTEAERRGNAVPEPHALVPPNLGRAGGRMRGTCCDLQPTRASSGRRPARSILGPAPLLAAATSEEFSSSMGRESSQGRSRAPPHTVGFSCRCPNLTTASS